MPFHSMTLSMRLANVPWVPRLPWGGKPAPGRSAACAVPCAVRSVRGFTSIAPASLRRPGSSRPCSSRFPRDRVSPSSRRTPHAARRGSRRGRRSSARSRGKQAEQRSRRAAALGRNSTSARAGSGLALSAPAPSGARPRRLGASARRARGAGRGALCGTPGTARVIVRADGEGGLSSLYPSGQGASERW
jgi:hypothetical protein